MSRTPKRVYVVDDDSQLREQIMLLLQGQGHLVKTYASGKGFLAAYPQLLPGCIILDLLMPGMGGIELQRSLLNMGCHWPVIVLTGRGDAPMARLAVEIGAISFLTKPVRELELAAAMMQAEAYLLGTSGSIPDPEITRRVLKLTPRERGVLRGILAGRFNKEIAAEFGITESTVKGYRRTVMKKLGARTAAELALLAIRAGVIKLGHAGGGPPPKGGRDPSQ